MPVYGYRCPNRHEFEIVQSMSEEAVASCPECGEQAQRIFYPTGIVFKGSGFYKTDSRGATSATTAGESATPPKEGGDAKPPAAPKDAPKPAPDKPASGGTAKPAAGD